MKTKFLLGIVSAVSADHGHDKCTDPNEQWSMDMYSFSCSNTEYKEKTSCVVTCQTDHYMIIEGGATKTKMYCKSGVWVPNKDFECRGPCRAPMKYIASKAYYVKPRVILQSESAVATRLSIRVRALTNSGKWTLALVFRVPLAANVTFRALEATVVQTENNDVITFHPKDFLSIKKGATYIFQAIAENVDWSELKAKNYEIAWYNEVYENTCCLVAMKFGHDDICNIKPVTTTMAPTTDGPNTTKKPTTTAGPTTEGPATTDSPGAWECGTGRRAPKNWKEERCTPQGKDHYCADKPAETVPDVKTSPSWAKYNYAQGLHNSILFYESQRSGVLPKSQRVNWRGDAHLNDGCDVNKDLTGGWYDAGDMVKFMLPGSAAATLVAWSIVEFGDTYVKNGEILHALRQVKWYGDFLVKMSPERDVVYGQQGDGVSDHGFWGRPENMDTNTQKRDTFIHTPANPASDLAGEMSATLSAVAKAFRMYATEYTTELFQDNGEDAGSSFIDYCCLEKMLEDYELHARWLLDFAEKYPGKYSDSNSDAKQFYKSWSSDDEPIWAAVWMAYNTGKTSDIDHAAEVYKCDMYQTELSWDDKIMGTDLIMAQLSGENCVKEKVDFDIDHILTRKQSPNGLSWVYKWGSARYSANLAFFTAVAQKHGHCTEDCWNFLNLQLNYILGDGTGHSLMVGGPGPNPPTNPHHASSFCPPYPAECDWHTGYDDNSIKNYYTLHGALVGGPDALDDKHVDDRTDWIENEVTCDYNAGMQGALAGILSLGDDSGVPTTVRTTTRATTKATKPPPTANCDTIDGAVMEADSDWWGGADYRVKNIKPWGQAKRIMMTFSYPLTVYESWYPFNKDDGRGSVDGETFSKKWWFEPLAGSTGQEFGLLVKHEYEGVYDIDILLLEYCF